MNKSVVYGLGGFIIGVVISGVIFMHYISSNPEGTILPSPTPAMDHSAMQMDGAGMTMNVMVENLKGKTGDDFDREFIKGMTDHHIGAIEMAKLAESQAKHEELKDMAKDVISSQSTEVEKMRQWKSSWGY